MGRRNNLASFFCYFALPLSFYCLFIGGGFYLVAIESLGYIPAFDLNFFTLDYYMEVWSSKNFISSLFFSTYIAFTSTVLSLILGTYFAQYLLFSNERVTKLLLENLGRVFLILPYLYIVFLVIFMFSDTGFFIRLLDFIGIKGFNGILYNKFGLGIIFAYTLKGFPFVMLFLLSIMTKIRRDFYDVASILGANHNQILLTVYIPLCKHAIIWSGLILFSYNLGSYEVPMLLTSIKQQTLSQLIYKLYTSPDLYDFPKAMALNITLLALNIGLGGLFSLFVAKVIRRFSI